MRSKEMTVCEVVTSIGVVPHDLRVAQQKRETLFTSMSSRLLLSRVVCKKIESEKGQTHHSLSSLAPPPTYSIRAFWFADRGPVVLIGVVKTRARGLSRRER
jgi:hypothetical protein